MQDQRQDDFERGLENRRAVLGDDWVSQATASANGFNAEFQEFITRYAWHEVWGRPGLDHNTRRLLVLGMTMGMARWEEFELHCRAALDGGVSAEQIKEALLQGAIYCGVPAANTAFKIAGKLLAQRQDLHPTPLLRGARVMLHHTFSQPQLQVAVQGLDVGVPVVLSHALGLDLSMWDELAAQLAPTHPVLRFDHRGHGGSAISDSPHTLNDMVSDAARVIREWGRGPVVFIVLSIGACVGQGLAIEHPDLVRALVLANGAARYSDTAREAFAARVAAIESGGMAAVADLALQRLVHTDFQNASPKMTRQLREQLLRCSPVGYIGACRAVAAVDWLDQLPRIGAPTLVIAGEHDLSVSLSMAQDVQSRIAHSRLHVIADASHLTVVEQPLEFGRQVQQFLTTI